MATVTTTPPKPELISSKSFRFRRTNRLLDAAAFGRVFKKAARSRDKFFTVLCRDNKDDAARLGLAISKKHCRKATARNRIKRVVRESFRQHQQELAGIDVVVMNQPAAAMANRDAMTESLNRHWKKCSSTKRNETRQES